MEATILFVAVAVLILLAVMSMRYGADSRDIFASRERELAAHWGVWGGSLPTRKRHRERAEGTTRLNLPRQELADNCLVAPCGA